MARVSWNGHEIRASIIGRLPSGNYKMMAQDHAPRIQPGTIIEVKPNEVLELDAAAGTAPVLSDSSGGPDATAPAPVAPVVAADVPAAPELREPVGDAPVRPVTMGAGALDTATAEHVVAQVGRELDAEVTQQNRTVKAMSKLAAIADRIRDKKLAHSKVADAFAAKLDELDKKEPGAFAMAEQVIAERAGDLDQFESDIRQLSNLGN